MPRTNRLGSNPGEQEVAAGHVHHNRGGAFLAEAHLHVVLQAGVDGQLHVGPRLPLLPVKLADHPPDGINLDPSRTGAAAQHVLHPRLDADLSDLETRDLQERIGVFQPRQVCLADGADIANHMREIRPERIVPGQTDLGEDPRQRRRVRGDLRHILPVQPFGHRDRHEGAAAADLAQGPLDVIVRKPDQFLQPRQHRRDVAGILAHHDHAVVLLVGGKDGAVAVVDHPAGGWQQPDGDAVLLGQQAEAVGLLDLHLAHPQGQHAEHSGLRAGHDHRPARDAPGAVLGVARRTPHSRLPRASTSPVAGLRTPSARWDTSTASG
jgi:hypothetical protein